MKKKTTIKIMKNTSTFLSASDIYFNTTHFSFITSLIGFYWHPLKKYEDKKKGLFEKAGE